jgi:hypothetical protein
MKYKIENVMNGFVFGEGEVMEGEDRDMIKEVFDKEGSVEWWKEYCGKDDVDDIVDDIVSLKEDNEYFWDEDSVLIFE